MARQKKSGNPIFSAIIVLIMGIVFLFMGLKDFIKTRGDLLDINTASSSEITDGAYVQGTFNYSYGAYCENITTTNYVIKRTTGYYYLVDVCDQSSEGQAYFIGVKVSKSDADDFDNLCYNDTPTPITIKGRVRKQSSEISGYMDDFIYEYFKQYYAYYDETFTTDDSLQLKNETLYYYIDLITPSDYLIPIGIGAVLFIIAILILFAGIKKKKRDAAYSQTYGSAAYNNPTYGNGYNGDMNFNQPYNNNNNNYGGDMNNYNPQPNSTYVDPFFNTGDEPTIAINTGEDDEPATISVEPGSNFSLKQ